MKHTWSSKSKKAHKKHADNRKTCKLRHQQKTSHSNKFTTDSHGDCFNEGCVVRCSCNDGNLRIVNKTPWRNGKSIKRQIVQKQIVQANKLKQHKIDDTESWFDYSNTTSRTVNILQQNFEKCVLETNQSSNLQALNFQTENLQISNNQRNLPGFSENFENYTDFENFNLETPPVQSRMLGAGMQSYPSLNEKLMNIRRKEVNLLADQFDSILQTPVTLAKTKEIVQIDELTTGFSSKL
jgi:hypothetical protein